MSDFWISVDSDQPIGACLVTDGDSIQYAYFNGDVYLDCWFRQIDIIAWYPINHPQVPGELMTPEQHAILLLNDEIQNLKRKIDKIRRSKILNKKKDKTQKI